MIKGIIPITQARSDREIVGPVIERVCGFKLSSLKND